MNYEEARVYLDNVTKYGSVLGLDAMRELLKRLGNPEKGLKIIHLRVDGGASANNFLMQCQADISQAPVERPCCIETTAMGCRS